MTSMYSDTTVDLMYRTELFAEQIGCLDVGPIGFLIAVVDEQSNLAGIELRAKGITPAVLTEKLCKYLDETPVHKYELFEECFSQMRTSQVRLARSRKLRQFQIFPEMILVDLLQEKKPNSATEVLISLGIDFDELSTVLNTALAQLSKFKVLRGDTSSTFIRCMVASALEAKDKVFQMNRTHLEARDSSKLTDFYDHALRSVQEAKHKVRARYAPRVRESAGDKCSFCGKSETHVPFLLSEICFSICNECIRIEHFKKPDHNPAAVVCSHCGEAVTVSEQSMMPGLGVFLCDHCFQWCEKELQKFERTHGKILPPRIQPRIEPLSIEAVLRRTKKNRLASKKCHFCGKNDTKLFANDVGDATICRDCLAQCTDILKSGLPAQAHDSCSFCQAPQSKPIVSGPGVFICSKCVDAFKEKRSPESIIKHVME